jgi:hypothetical protein
MGETAEELRHDIEDTRVSMSGTLEAIGDRVSPGRVLERRRNRMIVWVGNARASLMGTADDLTSRVNDTAHHLAEAPSTTMQGVRSNTKGAPLVAGGIAFGIGVLIGSVVPASRTERRLGEQVAGAAEPLKNQLQEAGREVAEHLREPVQEAVEDVKQSAQDSAQQLRESASDGAEQVRQAPRS